MDIKNWILDVEIAKSEYSTKVESLLSLYVQALHEFFNIEYETKNVNELLSKAEKSIEKESDRLFLEWIKKTGLIQMKRTLTLRLPVDATVAAKIKFVTGTLQDELQWEERNKKSTRSCIINTLTNLSEQLIRLSNLALKKEEICIKTEDTIFKVKLDLLKKESRPLETVVILI